MLPFIIFTIATAAMITTNTMANPTDSAEVYRNESGKRDDSSCYYIILFNRKKTKKGIPLQLKKCNVLSFYTIGSMP